MEGKIVFVGQSKDGTKYTIRYPQNSDAQAMTDYINTLSQEQTFIRMQGEEMKLEDEINYLEGQLKKITAKQTVQLFIVIENKIVGIAAIDARDKTESHEGVLGISLAKSYRGEGLGKKLMELILKEAEENIPQLRIVTLGVFGDNSLAQEMYKKFGFQEYGRLPEGILHKGKYIDHIYMYKQLR